MDDALFERFKAGDASARTAVRNQVRSMASRVLSAPQWRLTDTAARSEMERAAAQQALNASAPSALELSVTAMAEAGAAGVRWLRSKDGVHGDEHPDPSIMAGVALETASAAQAMRLEQHLKECHSCAKHMQVLKGALRAAATVQHAQPPPPPAPTPEKEAASRPPRPKKPAPKRPRRPPPRKNAGGPKLWPLVVLAGVVGGGVWWKSRLTPQEQAWAQAWTLPDERPPTARIDDYTGSERDAIAALERGDCLTAAGRLQSAAGKHPEDVWLRYYEGLAWVCERRGPEAVQALSQANEITTDLPWGFDWWWAQALVLDGDVDAALTTLDRLAASDHGRSADAKQLADALRAL